MAPGRRRATRSDVRRAGGVSPLLLREQGAHAPRSPGSTNGTNTTMIAQDPDIPKPLGIVDRLREIQERLGWLPHEEMQQLVADFAARGQVVPLHRIHEV